MTTIETLNIVNNALTLLANLSSVGSFILATKPAQQRKGRRKINYRGK